MSLPYPSMVFVPLDILTAEEMNQLVANIESLSAGTGLADGAVTSDKIAIPLFAITGTSGDYQSSIYKFTVDPSTPEYTSFIGMLYLRGSYPVGFRMQIGSTAGTIQSISFDSDKLSATTSGNIATVSYSGSSWSVCYAQYLKYHRLMKLTITRP